MVSTIIRVDCVYLNLGQKPSKARELVVAIGALHCSSAYRTAAYTGRHVFCLRPASNGLQARTGEHPLFHGRPTVGIARSIVRRMNGHRHLRLAILTWLVRSWLVGAALTWPTTALAQPAEPASPAASPPSETPSAPPSPAPALAVRSDEARGLEQEPGTDPVEVGLFVPRLVLTPPRLLLKLVFWPVQHGLRAIERHAVIERVEDVLYNDARTAGVLPNFLFISSQGPSVGFSVFHKDLAGHDESLSFDARFGGRYVQAYELGFSGDRVLGSPVWIENAVRFEVEPRLLFQGYGDAPEQAAGTGLDPRAAAIETRFRQTRVLNLLRLGIALGHPGRLVKLGATGILNYRNFNSSVDEGDPSIEEVYDTARLAGFDEGVRTGEINGNVVIDTRDNPGATGSGVYLDLFGGGVPRSGPYHYGHYGAELTTYWNLYRSTRVLVLRAVHEAVLGDEAEIPFSDLPRLGGPNRLRGYALDRFRDKTTAVASLEYHYPIHEVVAGSLFLDAGHAAAGYRDLMSMTDWRLGGGGGFILRTKSRILFTIDVAYGDGLQLYVTTDPLRAFAGRNEQL